MHIGEHISALRKTRNMTQGALALKSGISSSYMSDIECARREPTNAVLSKISSALDMSLSELFATSRFQITGLEAELLGDLRAGRYDAARALIAKLEGV